MRFVPESHKFKIPTKWHLFVTYKHRIWTKFVFHAPSKKIDFVWQLTIIDFYERKKCWRMPTRRRRCRAALFFKATRHRLYSIWKHDDNLHVFLIFLKQNSSPVYRASHFFNIYKSLLTSLLYISRTIPSCRRTHT